MAKPFETRELDSTRSLGRLFRRKRKTNAFIEISNLLAAAPRLEDVQSEQVEEIASDYGVRLDEEFLTERQQMFGELLKYCLADRHLDDAEIGRLKHLRRLLRLRQADVVTVETRVAQAVYEKSVDEVLADSHVSDEERAFLAKLQKRLRLPSAMAQSVFDMKAQELLQNTFDEAIQDKRLSPEEDKELRILADNLGGELQYDQETRRVLDKFRLYWKLENGELPAIEPDIKLPRSEICHFRTHAVWFEHRMVTRRFGYSGPTARIRIAKGIYWRAGSLGVKRTSEDVLKPIDSGICYLTSKRILFRGSRGNKTVPINRIIDIEAFSNGVQIEKDRGKSPFLEFEPGADVFAMILDRVIDQTISL